MHNFICCSLPLNIETNKDILDYIADKKFNTLVKELIRKDIKNPRAYDMYPLYLTNQ